MLAMRDEEVPLGLSLQPGDITGDPIFSEMKKRAEDLLAELMASGEFDQIANLHGTRLAQRHEEAPVAPVGKQTLIKLSDLLAELAA
jgi:hypothetical protein